MKGFWPAFLIGLPIGAVLAGALGVVAMQKKLKEAKTGWALVPVVVAAEDLSEGSPLTMEQISQRSIPEQFVVATMVRPDEASLVVGKVVTSPLQAGDPVLWTSFADHSRAQRVEACAAGIKSRVEPDIAAATSKAIAAIEPPEDLGEAPLAPPPEGANGMAQVLIVTRDLTEGTVLARGDLEVQGVDVRVVTASWLAAADLDTALGKRLVVPMIKGDAVWWQLLEDARRPSSPAGCEKAVADASLAAEKAAALREAKGWFDHEPPLKAAEPPTEAP